MQNSEDIQRQKVKGKRQERCGLMQNSEDIQLFLAKLLHRTVVV